ncbi:unnamed protein product [Adineta ricciae]|uniref:Solute carrier family 12 member 6 n=1 Tax=Adineta ricciae TaxID=249248 RepID=A0A815C1J0_ADIRI|nr:unnamed protein product [Adineta ricciae]CAF1490799.1 unnamed protein product [Adineta ricciae]
MSLDSFATAVSDPADLNGTGSIAGTKGRFKVVHIDEIDEETTKTSENEQQNHQDIKPSFVRDRSQIPTIELIKSDDDENNTEAQLAIEKEAGFLKNLYDYQGGTFMSNIDNLSTRPILSSGTQLNTLFGVYLPCVQNIIGVIVFIRLYWVIGVSGILQGMLIIGLCCLCTFLTAISLAAIATNGIVPAGGSYFLISRSLGPAVGGAVGFLFYIGNALAGGLYVLGASEILLKYTCPNKCHLFGPSIENQQSAFNHYRLYGTILLCFLGMIVFLGIKIVSRIAPFTLLIVFLSILSILVGIIKSAITPIYLPICIIEKDHIRHLLKSSVLKDNVARYCHSNVTCDGDLCPLQQVFCVDNISSTIVCNDLGNVRLINGIPGLKNSQFSNNFKSMHIEEGKIQNGLDGDPKVEVVIGIFFPSVTGIMAGSNRSGDLKDPSQSIPRGTILAVITTSIIYILIAFLLACSIQGVLLRDRDGLSVNQQLVEAVIAWPSPYVITIGALSACFGAGLQCLIGAPRLLQSVAKDDIMPVLTPFQLTFRNEPFRALLVTLFLSEISVLVANFDIVTTIVSEFFLMCYLSVNFVCFLQTLLQEPSWRPRFHFYHWFLSLLGVIVCIAIMFISSWLMALITLAVGAIVYLYIWYSGANKEWGEGLKGLPISIAHVALSHLSDQASHTKNFRPQILVFLKCLYNESQHRWMIEHENVLNLLSQLKAGKGLVILATVIEGRYDKKRDVAEQLREYLKEQMIIHKILNGFVDVLVTNNVYDGINSIMQTSGVSGFRPNTVMFDWPSSWQKYQVEEHVDDAIISYLDSIRLAENKKFAILLLKNIDSYPSLLEIQSGYIDIWWIIYDGGLLFLLAFLLQQHPVWNKCVLRLFTICLPNQEPESRQRELEEYVYNLRIQAEVHTITVADQEISAFTKYRTMTVVNSKDTNPFDIKKQHIQIERESHLQEIFQNYPPNGDRIHYTFTPSTERTFKEKRLAHTLVEDSQVRKKMHSAARLNQIILERSSDAQLVLINLPKVPRTNTNADYAYIEFVDQLCSGIYRCILVKGGGREVITIFS